jgi:ribosomal protein L25 (general stress protein Ctc)
MLDLASKKGIAITAAIAAAIIGSSFLVWLIPQSTTGNFNAPRTDGEVISDVYSRHLDLASSVESDYEGWRNGTMSSEDMLGRLESAREETRQLTQAVQRQPAAEWQQSYDLYEQALDVFGEYLGEIETAVENDETGAQQEIDSLKTEWQGYVDQSVQAMPIAR